MTRTAQDAAERWNELHLRLQDLLAGYADDVLDSQEKAMVEAHLAGCAACRNDVARQRALSRRLSAIPAPRLSAEFHERLDRALTAAQPEGRQSSWWSERWRRFTRSAPRASGAGFRSWAWVSGWVVSAALVIAMVAPTLFPADEGHIPMVRDVLAQYRQMAATTFPASARLRSARLPADWKNAHLLATWKTAVGGAPAQGFALRSGHSIVFQYRIDEAVFFRNPEVREAVAVAGSYQARSRNMRVLAVPLRDAGLLVVGPDRAVPSPGQLKIAPT